MGCLCCKAPGDKYAPDLLSKVDDMMKKMSDMSNVIKGQPGVDIIRGRTLVIFVFGKPIFLVIYYIFNLIIIMFYQSSLQQSQIFCLVIFFCHWYLGLFFLLLFKMYYVW